MGKITKPMKPSAVEPDQYDFLDYPLVAMPKLDGIRCVKVGGKVLSASFKPIPNRFIVECLEWMVPDGFDGEIMLRGEHEFSDVSSAVMSQEGKPDFVYRVFDYVGRGGASQPYRRRLEVLKNWFKTRGNPSKTGKVKAVRGESIANRVVMVAPTLVKGACDLRVLVNQFFDQGHEGAILRNPDSAYKMGRSTLREQGMLKIKRWHDAEARIVGFEEKQTNTNEAKRDELGRTKRSSAKAGKLGAGTLGALVVEDVNGGWKKKIFNVGIGFNDMLRRNIWLDREVLLGKVITYKYQKHGSKDKPRIPVFKSFRDMRDMEDSNG